MTLLFFADQGISARRASYDSPERKLMPSLAVNRLALKNLLHAVEQKLADERLMVALKQLAGLSDLHKPNVEGIVQQDRDPVEGYLALAPISQPSAVKLVKQAME